MTSPFGWCENSVIAPSGDFPSASTWHKDKELNLKQNRNRGHMPSSTNGENKHLFVPGQNFQSAQDSVLTLLPPRRDDIESISCLSTLCTTNTKTDSSYFNVHQQNDIPEGHLKNCVQDKYQPSVSSDKFVSLLPPPIPMAVLRKSCFQEQTSENCFSESLLRKGAIGFGFGTSPSSKSTEVERAKMIDKSLPNVNEIGFGFDSAKSLSSKSTKVYKESLANDNEIAFGFGFVKSPSKSTKIEKSKVCEKLPNVSEIGFDFLKFETSTNHEDINIMKKIDCRQTDEDKGHQADKTDFALQLSDLDESSKRKIAYDGDNILHHNVIGFGFGFVEPKPVESINAEVKKHEGIVQYLDTASESKRTETSCKVENVKINLDGDPSQSSQGDEQIERPKTPFSTRSSFVSGKFSFDVRSPMAQNYPPISPFVVKISGSNIFKMSNNKSKSTEKIMQACQQKEPIPLKLVFENLRDLKKVGEGVYGEVYSGFFGSNTHARVYKIVAVEGNELINGEKQKKYEEILPEIIISQKLSKLDEGVNGNFTVGFVKLYGTRVCKGTYPDTLIKAWKIWHDKNKSDNDCPDFKPRQLYVVFEFKFAGNDIEEFQFASAQQTLSAVLQVAHIFAVGECAFGFEHRDAHWGNILVEKTEEEFAAYVMNGMPFKVPTYGIKITVIDFTMSRVVDNGEPIFTDISADEEQFLGTGDLQFDIYRMTREYNDNDWAKFCPKTNIFWVHYLADKMYLQGRYSKNTPPAHAAHLRCLQRVKEVIMDFDSCYEFSTTYLSQLASVGNKNTK